MGHFLIPDDFPGMDDQDSATLIEDAEALAMLVAPCLASVETGDLTELQQTQALAILRGVITRWSSVGSSESVTQTAGPFQQTITPQARRNAFWPSEIKDLQSICGRRGRAFSIDLAPPRPDLRWH